MADFAVISEAILCRSVPRSTGFPAATPYLGCSGRWIRVCLRRRAVSVRFGPGDGAGGGRQVALDGKVLLRASQLSPPHLADRVSEVPQIVFQTRRPLRIRWIRSWPLPIAAEKLHDLDPSQRIRGASDAVANEAIKTGAEISDRNRLAQWQARLMKYFLRGKSLEFGPRSAPSANPNFTGPPTSGCALYQCGRSDGGNGRRLRPEATLRSRRRGGRERPE